jgi:response regulator NasT
MKRILLVDDDRVILGVLAESLRDLGYDVATAQSGADALSLADATDFDLAVLDVRMPGMSGIEVAEALRQTGNTPCVFLSAYGDADIVRAANAAGALGYLVKPVDVPQLAPFIEVATTRAAEINTLKTSADQLEQALSVEQRTRIAVGIVMARKQLDRDAAFAHLRTLARSQRRKIGEVADELIAAVETANALLGEG